MGEADQRARFARALQEAMEARKMSARQLAIRMDIDPRRIAAWLKGRGLPNLYEAALLADKLGVDEDLFRNPPEVPPPPPKPYYPIDRYLLDAAVESGTQEGLRRLRTPRRAAPAPRLRQPGRRAHAG
jgi:transcriptional regulator with XRE-family HTH domain